MVYISLLDARKAFDRVWINGLLYKMYKLGINAKLWRIFVSWYGNLKCRVRVGNCYSDEFKLLQGVFQGGKWSMRMFQIFYKDLIEELIQSNKGCNIHSSRMVCPTYADDLAIIAPMKSTMQELLNHVYMYASKWRIEFNASKSVMIKMPICGEIEDPCTLGGGHIKPKSMVEHLGTIVGNEDDVVANMLARGTKAFNAMLGIGSRTGGISPIVGSKIYWTAVIPSMLYGVEVAALSSSAIDKLEQQHRLFAKRLQCISPNTPNPIAYATLGWTSIRSYITKRTLHFIHSMLLCDSSSVYRVVCIDRLIELIDTVIDSGRIQTNSPCKWFIQACLRYDLFDNIRDMICTGETVSKASWKKTCQAQISADEAAMIRIERLLYENLGYTSPESKMDLWWKVAFHYPESLRGCRFMVKCKLGIEPLRCNTYRTDNGDKVCPLCGDGDEHLRHFLFQCIALQDARTKVTECICMVSDDGINTIMHQSVSNVVNPAGIRLNFKILADLATAILNMYSVRCRYIEMFESNHMD